MFKKVVFVFGSNLAGRHGKGAALFAKKHYKAEYGKGKGIQGDSYALPTKDEDLRPLPWEKVEEGLEELFEYANNNPETLFLLTPVGTGLAGNSKGLLFNFMDTHPTPFNVALTPSWIF